MYLFFDTETDGMINFSAPPEKAPRVIQLAWQLYGFDRQLVTSAVDLIKPDGWTVPNEKFWIDNGFTNEQNEAQGIPIADAMHKYLEALASAMYRVAHNITFDAIILRGEMMRLNIPGDFSQPKICTMRESTNYCKLPSKRGFKFPKLAELHQRLFDQGFDGAHDAMADVQATARCFFELVDRGVILLPEPTLF